MMCYCKRIQPKEEEEPHLLIAMERRALLQPPKLALFHGLVWFAPALTFVAAAAAAATLPFFLCEFVTLKV